MFPTSHPDLARLLTDERIGRLLADAESYRRARPFLARRRSARSVERAGGLGRVAPASAARSAKATETAKAKARTDRAA